MKQHLKEFRETDRIQKKEIADLKKQVAKLLPKKEKVKIDPEKVKNARLSAKQIESQRNKLGLSREEFGTLLGASANTIYMWEKGKTKPRDNYKAKIIELRGLGKREMQKRLEANTAEKPEK